MSTENAIIKADRKYSLLFNIYTEEECDISLSVSIEYRKPANEKENMNVNQVFFFQSTWGRWHSDGEIGFSIISQNDGFH